MNELRDDVVDYVVTWAEVHRDTKLLARKLIGTDEWKGIIAVTRGGLVPAAIIAREMDIRNIDTICIATYDEQYIGDVNMIKVPDLAVAEKGEGWLMIDDLVDTGATIKAARELLPNCHIATVYAKEMGRPSVDTFVHEVPQNYWVFFPWDTDVQYSAPLHSANGGD
ncbi:MAG: xanthine phosphoribosyltransferase [Rhodospirillales bacterium]|jgi:xanthine phosphoribosyltransferase|nr:xanthine phosphoribosyltransferase [Rhodospirillales bacterium]MDP7101551.1 xanthine phosphoribosyltransferase [Rhodospirillales bacterium]MDP7425376.1 xanthine phosphoribosyltransferase [Rhodospirillales bacterium]MDP7626180.1 xanthine phosphoribosyltransferase [Rhodospirillales bacterium]HJO87284.1 xanthine phosphoribosyltransferase [Rhodospirillales bacterium]|tara:strand:- start:165 stop:665 length:501 start_codon:yes stop_codon:yes gene_type:complete